MPNPNQHSPSKTNNHNHHQRSFSFWQLLPLLAGGLALALAVRNLGRVSGPGCGRLWLGRYAFPSLAESLILVIVGGLLVWGALKLRSETIRKIAGQLAVAGFGVLLALVMVEIFLRLTEAPHPSVDDLILANHDRLGYLRKTDWTLDIRSPQGEFHNIYTSDDLGLIIRDDNPNRPQADALRLLMVGDSLLDGLEVPARSNMSELIEDQLVAATGQPIQVINAGHQSYDATTYYLTYLEFADMFDPEIVVAFFFVGNDFTYAPRYYHAGRVKVDQEDVPVAMYPRFDLENYTYWDVDTPGYVPIGVREAEDQQPKGLRLRAFIKDKALPFVLQRTIHPICLQLEAHIPSGLPDYTPDWEPCADLSGELTDLCNNYRLRNQSLIRNNYVAIFKDEYTDLDWEDVELSLRPLALLNQAAERDGRKLLIVIVPQKAQLPQAGTSYVVGVSDDEYIDSTRPQDVTLAFCEAEHLTCFDLLPTFRRHADQQLFWLSDQHFNETGHQVAADAITEVLLDMVEQP